jgi:hypothetical protein
MEEILLQVKIDLINLITALRTAIDNDGIPDKESTPYNDIFDILGISDRFYSFEDRRDDH